MTLPRHAIVIAGPASGVGKTTIALLGIPAQIVLVAHFCLGYVTAFLSDPELATAGWQSRVPLAEVLYVRRYGAVDPRRAQALAQSSHAGTSKGVS